MASFDYENKIATFYPSSETKGEKIPFSSILDYKIEENTQIKVASGLKSASVGTALFGTHGMIEGALIGKGKEKEFIDDLTMEIKIFKAPNIKLKLITSTVKKSSVDYQLACSHLDLMATLLDPIISSNQNSIEILTNNVDTSIETSKNLTDEIRQFKDLLDDGIISQKEFDTKKAKLLSRQ